MAGSLAQSVVGLVDSFFFFLFPSLSPLVRPEEVWCDAPGDPQTGLPLESFPTKRALAMVMTLFFFFF